MARTAQETLSAGVLRDRHNRREVVLLAPNAPLAAGDYQAMGAVFDADGREHLAVVNNLPSGGGTFPVLADFGAQGDGLSDDTVAIQGAVDALGDIYDDTGVPQTLFAAAKEYRVSYIGTPIGPIGFGDYIPAIRWRSGVTLVGVEGKTKFTAATLPNTQLNGSQDLSAAGVITVDSTADFPASGQLQFEDVNDIVTYTGKTGTTFTGCTGGASTVPDNAAVVLRRSTAVIAAFHDTDQVHDWNIRHVIFDGNTPLPVEIDATAIAVGAAHDFNVDDNEFFHFLGKPLQVLGENNGVATRVPQRWKFRRNHVHDCTSNVVGWSGAGSYDFDITDNDIYDNQSLGAESLIGLNQPEVSGGRILRNRIVNWGPVNVGGDKMEIAGNTIVAPATYPDAGIRCDIGSDITIDDNDVDMSATSSAQCHAIKATEAALSHFKVTNNRIRRAVGAAVIVFYPSAGTHSDVKIKDNDITGGTAGGSASITVNATNGVRVDGNSVKDTASVVGIEVGGGSTKVRADGNTLKGCYMIMGSDNAVLAANDVEAPVGEAALLVYGDGTSVTGGYLKGGAAGGLGALLIKASAQRCAAVGVVLDVYTAGHLAVNEEGGGDYNKIAYCPRLNGGVTQITGANSAVVG